MNVEEREQIRANRDFIRFRCEICGGTDVADTVLSEIIITAGYGSKLDGERVRLKICGECADRVLSAMELDVDGRYENGSNNRE